MAAKRINDLLIFAGGILCCLLHELCAGEQIEGDILSRVHFLGESLAP